MYRLYIGETEELEQAQAILDGKNIPYDSDLGNRLLLGDGYIYEALELLDAAGIDYEEVG